MTELKIVVPCYNEEETLPGTSQKLLDILDGLIHGHLHEGLLIGWMAKWIFFWRRIPLICGKCACPIRPEICP